MAPPVNDVSVQEFADLIGVTSQRVYQHIQDGMPHRKRKRGTRIVPREAIPWLIDRARETAKRESKKDDDSDLARIRRADADLKELELEERRGELVPLAQLTAFLDRFVGGFAATASGRLQRFERDIVRVATPGEARRLTQQIHAALMAGAQEFADALEQEDADDEGEQPDDPPSEAA